MTTIPVTGKITAIEVNSANGTAPILDENNNDVAIYIGGTTGHGVRMRKIATGMTFPTWGLT